MEKKITKKEMFSAIYADLEAMENIECLNEKLEFIDHEIELIERKASSKTMTAKQKENLEIMEIIKEVLAASNKPLSISEIQSADERLSGYGNQKISALISLMKKDNLIVRTEIKRIAHFALA